MRSSSRIDVVQTSKAAWGFTHGYTTAPAGGEEGTGDTLTFATCTWRVCRSSEASVQVFEGTPGHRDFLAPPRVVLGSELTSWMI